MTFICGQKDHESPETITIHHLGPALWDVLVSTAHLIVGDGKPREWKELAWSQSRVEVPMVLWCDSHAEQIQLRSL